MEQNITAFLDKEQMIDYSITAYIIFFIDLFFKILWLIDICC